MRTSSWTILVILLWLVAAPLAGADVVSDWNEAARAIVAEVAGPGPQAPPRLGVEAQVALAMFEAVNAIDRRFESYLGFPAATAAASPEAAAAVAAHSVLTSVFPGHRPKLDQSLAFHLGLVADGPAKAAGVATGHAAAEAVLKRRRLDSQKPLPHYRPRTSPGVYVQPGLPSLPMSAFVSIPWFLKAPDEVQPPPPPALTSERYARDFDEVRRLGGRERSERTAAQSASADFWAGNRMMLTMRLLTARDGRSLVANARAYALYEMALDDTAAAVAIAKYRTDFWRPITAIRNADEDGNPQTTIDAAWMPYLPTPGFGEYPCGHCSAAAMSAAIVEAEFGRDAPLTFIDSTMPGAGQTLTPADYVREVSMSRIYAGVHYRFSNEAAEEMGRRIAGLAIARSMRPLVARSAQ